MARLYLELITPERIMVSQEVDSVVAPGSLGQFGILPGHAPFLTGIVPGEFRYESEGKSVRMAVTYGFLEVSHNKVSILVDAAEREEEIDVERARKALQRAKERLSKGRGAPDIDYERAEAALRRAIARLKVAGRDIQA